MSRDAPITVMIAGMAGASLGTEIAKALAAAGGYHVLGCDISPLAYGHFDAHFAETFLAERDDYVASVLRLCRAAGVEVLIPGGDQPAALLAPAAARFAEAGIRIAQNAPEVVAVATDKTRCFEVLGAAGVPIPTTRGIAAPGDIAGFPTPCVIKPSSASGGSAFVFFARDPGEAELYCAYLLRNGIAPVAQAYVPVEGGEFTVGVLSDPDGSVAGVIALRRAFTSKLSVLARGPDFLISSGYTQGRIEPFPEVCAAARHIAETLGSRGPLNVQGRVDPDGRFVPFEINPRFSASTYLRTLAGFNEVDHFLRRLTGWPPAAPLGLRPGWYLRSLTETVTPDEKRT
ncbi:hypothetical protein BYZ73_13625 [Rhodovulum viride]|uniref:ATP-grasp domain-containing protein n=1 Tax=Rhodovulum viride TaxID=1231134 RepID=A0ABX9DEL4_9RHOB|nr:ATP-grasp domain-containing protein [Rhodovulum viride]RAP40800.1 hypothetical protein BYZ73_13625 [Rhodovulum viride]